MTTDQTFPELPLPNSSTGLIHFGQYRYRFGQHLERLRITAQHQKVATPARGTWMASDQSFQRISTINSSIMNPDVSTVTNGDVTIGVDTVSGQDVVLRYVDRVYGVNIIGQTGTGKSSLLERLSLRDLEYRIPGILWDSHGQLGRRIVSLADPRDAERVIFLTPLPEPFGLNLLACRPSRGPSDDPVSGAVISLIATVKKVFGDTDQHLPTLVTNLDLAARTLIPSGLTLVDAFRLFIKPKFREDCLRRVSDPEELEDLRDQWAFYESIPSRDRSAHIQALRSRLRQMLAPKVMRRILGSSTTTIPFDKVLNGDSFIIVNLPSSDQMPRELCDFIGSMILCAFADRVFARYQDGGYGTSGDIPPRFHLYLDEYQRFASKTTAELLTQARKFGAGVTLAHQGTEQIRDELVRRAGLEARTQIICSVTGPDSDLYARVLPVEPKPERIDWVSHPDETVDLKVPTGQPVRLIRTKPPGDPSVADAVRILFEPVPAAPGEYKKLHDVNIDNPDEDVRINRLLVDAMRQKLRDPKVFATRLVALLYVFSENSYEDKYGGRLAYASSRRPRTGRFDGGPRETWHTKSILADLSAWLDVYLKYKEEFLKGVTSSSSRSESAVFDDGRVSRDPLVCALRSSQRSYRRLQEFKRDIAVYAFQTADAALLEASVHYATGGDYYPGCSDSSRHETIVIMRERLRCMIILSEFLAEHPILESSGQQIPKTVPVPVQPRRSKTRGTCWPADLPILRSRTLRMSNL